MMNDTFKKLAPFIQDYIYRNKWEDLREIQVKSCEAIFNTDDNLLLTSSTASGKTEAAFLPVLTEIYKNPSTSVSVLYISPLKALINDQFERINESLKEANLKVTKWHGDSNQTRKEKIINDPNGIIQITPESLEALLMNKKEEIYNLLHDLRFIIIDEVHYFIASERGIQLESCLTRIDRIIKHSPRRIGLSATLGDYTEVEKWLCSGTERKCTTPVTVPGKRQVSLYLEEYDKKDKFLNDLYKYSLDQKCIIFSNSRSSVEENIANLKEIAKNNKTEDLYFTHHGSINKTLREDTEYQMKNTDKKMVIGATLTLELGIDLGNIDRIIQTGTPFSVSSFVQRLGRSGRRNGKSVMLFLFDKSEKEKSKIFYENIDFDIIMCIAIIEIYMKEKWVEPLLTPKYPYEILYHQTLSHIASIHSITPQELAQYMLTIDIFKNVTQEDYKILLNHMIQNNHLRLTESNELIIGEDIEKELNNYKFYSVFQNQIEYTVYGDSKPLGTITENLKVGKKIKLSGRTWEVTSIDNEKLKIFTKPSTGDAEITWKSNVSSIIDGKIIKKIKEILESDEEYQYLDENAKKILKENRKIFKDNKLNKEKVIIENIEDKVIFPWVGTKSLITLSNILTNHHIDNTILKCNGIPIGIKSNDILVKNRFEDIVKNIDKINIDDLKIQDYETNKKFSNYLPEELKEKEYRYDYLDIELLKKELE